MKKIICSIILGLLLITGVMCTSTIEAKAETSLDDMDYNLDSIIDIEDLSNLAVKYNVASDNSKWESKYDLNGDNIIDIYDIVQMNKKMGQETPTIRDNKDITSKFTDANFKTAVYTLIRKTSPSTILYSDVRNIKGLDVSSKKIGNLSGIEYFSSLTYLDCDSNGLTSLDVSKNTALLSLYCLFNKLTTLDISQNTALLELGCIDNQLTSLDVSKNTALTGLFCSFNSIESLDVSNNTALTVLYCDSNQLTSLDVSNNTALTTLWCYDNQLKSLDVSENTALTELECYNNQLASLDVSGSTTLTTLWCYDNQLTSLDVSKNIALKNLSCYRNQLTSLDVSKNTVLTNFNCTYNQLTTFYATKEWDVSCYKTQYTDANHTATNTNLISITDISSYFTDEHFKTIVYNLIGKTSPERILYSDVKNIDVLNVSEKNIRNMSGIEYFTSLTNLDCGYNKLTTLDVSKNTKLSTFNCSYNELTTLYSFKGWDDSAYKTQYTDTSRTTTNKDLINLNDNEDLTSKFTDENFKDAIYAKIGKASPEPILYFDIKGIKQLDVKNKAISNLNGVEYFTALEVLSCSYNQLTSLDVSKNTAIDYLDCSYNKLISLDVSNNIALTRLNCSGSQLISLDVSNNRALYELNCSGSQLTSLDVSSNRALYELICSNNQLASLDVSKNTALRYLNCKFNQITTFYSTKAWDDICYKIQYTDANHRTTTDNLTITIIN